VRHRLGVPAVGVRDVAEAVQRAGQVLLVTELAVQGQRPLALPRVEVLASDSGTRFRLRVAAARWPGPARRAAYRLLRATRRLAG
jgi:hypothetical protein